jgi:uncharacterized protein YbaR (Trm112 family)
MSANPAHKMKFDPSVVSELACPACYGSLRHEDPRLVCAACGRAYPIIDGIPALIVDRAETADKTS